MLLFRTSYSVTLHPSNTTQTRALSFRKWRNRSYKLPLRFLARTKMNQYDRNSNVIGNTNEGLNTGKRQRLMNLMKTTKDVYLPSITSSISQRAAGAAESFRGNEQSQAYSNLPQDMNIIFYPTYTTQSRENFETTIRFAVCAPGNPASRRNRILLSLCKQYLKPTNSEDGEEDLSESKWDDIPAGSDSRSTLSGTSNTPSVNELPNSTHDTGAPDELNVLKTRIAGFLVRKVPNLPIIVDLLSHEGSGHYDTCFGTTDNMGNVLLKMQTDFLPTTIRITLDTPTDFPKVISNEYSCAFIQPGGYGVISDIDDTIKHTGVTGDKRSMFRSVFVNDTDSWLIDDVSRWYKSLKEQLNVNFFYVSNSPMQTYPTLQTYIDSHFPWGPLFLKQYSGNLLSSIMTSSAKRKLGAITQILKDFPAKKFVLVGDSGEQDFEAYISTAMQYPDQIIGIYVRCCKDSMSDMGLREIEVMRELNDIINEEYLPIQVAADQCGPTSGRPSPPVPPVKPRLTPEQEEDIRQSRQTVPPSLPPRPSNKQDLDSTVYYTPSTQNDYGTYNTFFDKKADNWRNRVINGVQKLKQLDNKRRIRLMFFIKPEVPLKDCMMEMQQK